MQKISKLKPFGSKFRSSPGEGQVGTKAYKRHRQLKNKSARRARAHNRDD